MHEVSIVEMLIKQIESQAAASGHAGQVTRVELVVGRLAGVSVDSIRFAFEMLSPDTRVAGAELHVDEPRAVCVCRDCGARSEIDGLAAECPACASEQFAIEGGQQLLLKTIELEE